MDIGLVLYPEVVYFVKHRCNREGRVEFYRQLRLIRTEPPGHSEGTADRSVAALFRGPFASKITSPFSRSTRVVRE